MKRLMALLICLVLLVTASAAMAADYDDLAEKFEQQVRKGSSVVGVFALRTAGDAEWAQLLAPLSDVKVQVRLERDTAANTFNYQFYTVDDAKQPYGVTNVYGDQEAVYLRSDLLLDTLLKLPAHGDQLSTVTGIGMSNPTWYSALLNILSVRDAEWETGWEPVLAKYNAHIEQWMAPYAAAPRVLSGDSGTTMEISYDIPADAVKAEIKSLLTMALDDELLMRLVRVQMTDEQNTVYLNKALMWYYEALIDALPIAGDVAIEHTVTAKGDRLYASLTLPLVNVDGLTELKMEQEPGVSTYTVTGEAGQLIMTVEDARGTTTTGTLTVLPVDGDALDVAYVIRKETSAYTDDKTNNHEIAEWTIDLTQNDVVEEAMAFVPTTISIQQHYYSKMLNDQSTTLELSASLVSGSDSFVFKCKLTTALGNVSLDDLPREGAKDLSAMTDEERAELWADLFANALVFYGTSAQQEAAQ